MLNSLKPKNSTNLKKIANTLLANPSLETELSKLLLTKTVPYSTTSKGTSKNRKYTTTSNTTSSNNVLNKPIIIEEETKRADVEFGFLFDIDGVLVRGKSLLPHTKDCMKLLTDKKGNFKVPTVFVTNAGNTLRSVKAASLSNVLGVNVKPDQVVMSHSPLKMLKNFHNKRTLISGQGPIIDIAKNLGFQNIITMDDIRRFQPQLDMVDHKRRNFAPCVLGRYFPPIECIVLFGESVRWETNLQLIIDVLMSNGNLNHIPKDFPSTNLPVLACNTDMVWMAEAKMPRFGHGAFLHCLEQIYHKLSGQDLQYSAIVGKPSEITYYYAEEMLQNHAESLGLNRNLRRLYAVGDNLDTDIYGANIFNQLLDNNKQYRENRINKKKTSTKPTTTTTTPNVVEGVMKSESELDLIEQKISF